MVRVFPAFEGPPPLFTFPLENFVSCYCNTYNNDPSKTHTNSLQKVGHAKFGSLQDAAGDRDS